MIQYGSKMVPNCGQYDSKTLICSSLYRGANRGIRRRNAGFAGLALAPILEEKYSKTTLDRPLELR
jgi:hypothetical protein